MSKLLWNILKFLHLGPLLIYIHPKSALRKVGWFKSFHKKSVIDKDGNPIPWWTYSFIDFIQHRLNNKMRILEFGCGGSTIYLSYKAKEVISFEDYPDWAKKTSKKIKSDSSQIIVVSDISDFTSYSDKILGEFDILIVDNLGNRIACARNNIKYLKDDGVVIWDNTDGPDWEEINLLMHTNGFKEISFTGMVAQELSYSRTTLFYRAKNCLNV